MIDANCGGEEIYIDCILVSSPPRPICIESLSSPTGFQEAIVTKDLFLADVLTKTVYATLAIAAFMFVSMLLLTGLH
jgi:hypothetical protein